MRVFDVHTEEIIEFKGNHTMPIKCCDFFPDGKRFISGSTDKTIKVWDMEKNEVLKTLKGHSRLVSTCCVSSNGKLIISGSADKTIKVFDSEIGSELYTIRGHTDNITSCRVTHDSKLLISGSDDRTIRCWNLQSNGQHLRTIQSHEKVRFLSISPNDKYLLSVSIDNILSVFDLQTFKLITILENVFCADISNDILVTFAPTPESSLVSLYFLDPNQQNFDNYILCLPTFEKPLPPVPKKEKLLQKIPAPPTQQSQLAAFEKVLRGADT